MMRPLGCPLSFAVVLLMISMIVFLAAMHWQPLEIVFALAPKRHHVSRPDVRVWANKQSGLYYCPGSKLYGVQKQAGTCPSGRPCRLDTVRPRKCIANR